MTRTPRTVTPDRLAAETLQTMQGPPQIGEMPVLDDEQVVGMLNETCCAQGSFNVTDRFLHHTEEPEGR